MSIGLATAGAIYFTSAGRVSTARIAEYDKTLIIMAINCGGESAPGKGSPLIGVVNGFDGT